jgi:hypothetical protein
LAHWAGCAFVGCIGAGSFGKSNKPLQQPSDETQLMAEGATSDQVLVERVL